MGQVTKPRWQRRRTKETRDVEDSSANGIFPRTDAYRYNSVSIRIRVIDERL